MKKILFISLLLFCITNICGQDVTKKDICKGAAFSIVYTIDGAVRANMSEVMVKEMSNESFKKVALPYVEKAYKLLKQGKERSKVVEVIQSELMKIDNEILFQGLLKGSKEN